MPMAISRAMIPTTSRWRSGTFGNVTAAEVDAGVAAIKNSLAGLDASKDTTGATAEDAARSSG